MAVTSVTERFQDRRSSIKDGKISHTRSFMVVCSSINDGTAAAITANDGSHSIPASGAAHPSGDGSVVTSKDANPVANSDVHFIVSVEYSIPDGETTGEIATNPLLDPIEFRYGAAEYTESYFVDKSSTPKPVVNAAGDTFEQLPTRDASMPTIEFEKNVASYNPLTYAGYANSINNANVTIDGVTYAAKTLRLKPIKAVKKSVVFEGDPLTYYTLSFQILINPATWDVKIPNIGFNELVSGKLAPILDDRGRAIIKPRPLNSDGSKKDVGEAPDDLVFAAYEEKTLTTVGL